MANRLNRNDKWNRETSMHCEICGWCIFCFGHCLDCVCYEKWYIRFTKG